MTRDEALALVSGWTKNQNLIKHMLAVEAQMRALAKHFREDPEQWGLAGLIHDADYDQWPESHPQKTLDELQKRGEPGWLTDAVRRHAWGYHGFKEEPETKLEWSLYCCDELSGLIIACALVRPDKKLASVEVDSVLKKWKKKDFAAGVHREQIELCEEKLGIKLNDFIGICLQALQGIAGDLGL
ncbi:MAG: Metal dependent phosphohydrolase [Candidatus Beckwithbacteria bacterium GW2011_GWB1_47_15]|uniref:Metal dependent phosphohydrolase n=1 Tax=Candidatus Beckwithbacteria bacterium GW2011_GWB1_47_15 TaxID=1618371 RepID=A0A0G1U786_9BACT|nr:MAG: Metal dependent phosphohydrolase [Candidatus Beckwithbacteria bacterium GW2011_GWC1_49_16]AQS30915.1 hypothetical protein [uncultured bacterium]KKU36099.1 MAG: Metal dependent phosphohydrolase [Candidatus Beckwithbacteria bacterium GW2011_GWA1_46_30]KKU62063.1 MAG: Metal dependent phosphohydrolase [Candidatus Beckwithbacteria bacterium GW2011_GWB1_47_15]KKU72384.1 MAG: Metal dependent phosphohydrolase [Candidatus Beckwithbacteria bacterium GW2011_GWA2_47_25]OGD49291.1 MAG: hypothetical